MVTRSKVFEFSTWETFFLSMDLHGSETTMGFYRRNIEKFKSLPTLYGIIKLGRERGLIEIEPCKKGYKKNIITLTQRGKDLKIALNEVKENLYF